MADIYLDVPYVSQLNIGGHAGVGHSEINGCWYASVCMLGYYREAGPRLGVPERYKNPDGTPRLGSAGGADPLPITPSEMPELLKNEGLTKVPLPSAKAWTADALAEILRTSGPVLVGRGFRNWTTGQLIGGHFIVLIGAKGSDNTVTVHDPGYGPNIACPLATFNDFFPWDRPEAPYLMTVKLSRTVA
jgi:hypothetical protein